MKKILLFVFLFAAAVAQSQSNIELHLSPRLGTKTFALGAVVSAGNYEYKITRLEYYISGIEITHDGGEKTAMTDLYLLVRPAVDSMYDLGSHPHITKVEGIKFSVGVDQAKNHLDPAGYPASHPLAPQNPAMQWGWSAGYRFVAIEGVAGNNFVNTFEVHALGDANYKSLNLATEAENHADGNKTIHLVADYSQVIKSLNVSGGLVVHGSSGAAVTLLNNMAKAVFSAESSVMTIDPMFTGRFLVSPNPATNGQAMVSMNLPAGFDYRLTVTDLAGRVLQNQEIATETQSFSLKNNLNAGAYLVHLWQNERPVAVEKLFINP